MGLFETVRTNVSARQAAEHYGLKVNRKGMACCPFHNDKNPSMKIDRRFYCFGCGEKGDAIDYVFGSMTGILRMTFRFAYEEYWIADDTFSRVNLKKFKDMLMPDVDIEKRVHPTEDVKRILDAVHDYQQRKPEYTPAWALELQILIGARRGEIAPLRRCDITDRYVSITREQITVKKFNDIPEHFKIVEHTKTYKNRIFPRTDALNDYLGRLGEMLDRYYPESEFLFPDRNTEAGVINNNTVYRLYGRICRKLGIKISKEAVKGTHSFSVSFDI